MSIGTPQYEDFSSFTAYSTVGPSRAAHYWQLEDGAPYELIRGRLIMSPGPSPLHQIILRKLSRFFEDIEESSGGLGLIAPMDVVFSDDTILQPDFLYLSKQQRHLVNKHVQGAPDLVIEILSDSTGRRDRTEKLDLYAKYGVPEYWIVDPATQVFEFLLLDPSKDGGKYVIEQQPDNHYRSPLLPEIEIDLAAFWGEIERRLPQQKSS